MGRADELESLERVLDELDRGRPGAIELVGRAGDRQDAAAHGARALARSCAGTSSSRGRRRSSSATCRSRSSWMRWTSTSRAWSPTQLADPRRRRPSRARARLPVAVGARRRPRGGAPARALPQPPRGARAARASRADEAARARARRLPLGRLGVGRAARRAAAPAAGGGRAHRGGAPPPPDAGASCSRARAGASCGGADPDRARRAHAASRRESFSAKRSTPPSAAVLYEESGGNPFYLEQLARSLERAACEPPPLAEISLTGIGVPPAVAASLSRGARAAVRRRHASCSKERRWRAIHSSPSWRRPRPRHPRLRRWTQSTSSCGSISFARPTCRDASASGTRSSGARSTRPPPAAGGSGPTSGARRRSRRGGRQRRRAPTTSSGRRAQGDLAAVAVLREAGEAAARLAPESAARWFGGALRLLPQTAPARGARRASARPCRGVGGGGPFHRQP